MKTLSNQISVIILVYGQLSFCEAQSNESTSLKVTSLTVNYFPDSETVFKVLEKGNIDMLELHVG